MSLDEARVDAEYNGNGTGNVHIHNNGKNDVFRIDNEGIHEYELSKPLKKIIAKDFKFEKYVKHAIEWLKETGDY